MSYNTKINEEGSATIEFVILMPLYVILFLGTYYIGNGFLTRQKLHFNARTFSEVRGGWPLAADMQDIFDKGMYNVSMTNYSSVDLNLNDEQGWGGGDDFTTQFVTDMTTVPLNPDIADDTGRALRGNRRPDPDRGYDIGGHIGRYGTQAESNAAMMEYDTSGTLPEGEERKYSDIYWQWYVARAHYSITRGGGPGFGSLYSEVFPYQTYRHLMEVNVSTYFPDPGQYLGRMPYEMYQRLEPSPWVISPRHWRFPRPIPNMPPPIPQPLPPSPLSPP